MVRQSNTAAVAASITPLPSLDPQQRYSIEESARYLRLSRASVYADIKAGLIAVIKHRKRTYIHGKELVRASATDVRPPVAPRRRSNHKSTR